MNSHFFISLPSNVIEKKENNTIADFITNLPYPIKFDSTWEVGLSEISYPFSWYNILSRQRVDVVDIDGKSYLLRPMFLEPGYYDDANKLADLIARMLAAYIDEDLVQSKPSIYHDGISHKFQCFLGIKKDTLENLYLMFDSELSAMLGFRDVKGNELEKYPKLKIENNFGAYWAPECFDFTAGIRELFVYSDVCDYSIVGNSSHQLLRTVKTPYNYQYGQQFVVTYDRANYIPLSSSEISSIKVSIKDGMGNPIQFQFGRTVVTLHFRKKDE